MSEPLFDRVVTLAIAGNELDGYDVEFEVEKTLEAQPNKAKIKVFNLPEEIRVAAQQAHAQVNLKAGYRRTAGQIFQGDIRYSASAVVGADWVTVIEAGDGEKAYREATVSLTWAKGKPLKNIVQEIVGTFDGLLPGDFEKTIGTKLKEQFPRGGALNGNSMRVLDELLRGYGFRVSIQDGKFQFVDASGENQRVAVVLTPDTGLINEPELGEKDKNTGKAKGKVKCLLQPTIVPGSVIDVEGTSTIKGRFVAQKVVHTGNNGYAQPFYTDVEVLTK